MYVSVSECECVCVCMNGALQWTGIQSGVAKSCQDKAIMEDG